MVHIFWSISLDGIYVARKNDQTSIATIEGEIQPDNISAFRKIAIRAQLDILSKLWTTIYQKAGKTFFITQLMNYMKVDH